MAIGTVYTGTWEEVKSHEEELRGRQVRVIVENEPAPTKDERLARFEHTLKRIEALGKHSPPFPERALTTDFYYPDDPI